MCTNYKKINLKNYMKKLIMFVVLGLMFTSVASARTIINDSCNIDPTGLADQICGDVPDVEIIPNVDPIEDIDPVVPPVIVPSHHINSGYMMPLPVFTQPVYVWDVVKLGDKGQSVKDFQTLLNNHGAKLVVDGIYGPKTDSAWKSLESVFIK